MSIQSDKPSSTLGGGGTSSLMDAIPTCIDISKDTSVRRPTATAATTSHSSSSSLRPPPPAYPPPPATTATTTTTTSKTNGGRDSNKSSNELKDSKSSKGSDHIEEQHHDEIHESAFTLFYDASIDIIPSTLSIIPEINIS